MAQYQMKPPSPTILSGTGAGGKIFTVRPEGYAIVDDASKASLLAAGWTLVQTVAPDNYATVNTDPLTGGKVLQAGGETTYLGRGVIANDCPNTVLTDNSTTGIGSTLSQIGFVTIPGGVMKAKSKVLVNCAFGLTGNDSKTVTLRAGPASGSFATATGFGGQSGLTTQVWAPLTALLWNNGTLSSQKASPANTPNYMSQSGNPLIAMNIDTSLDWNIYFGVQSSVANGAPSNTFTLLEYFIELVG